MIQLSLPRIWCCVLILVVMGSYAVTGAEERHQDHEALRAMLKTVTEAMNTKRLEALSPLFYDKFSITTVEQKQFTNFADFKAYFTDLFTGPKAPLRSITFQPQADALTEFVGDNIGLSHGTSRDTYTFANGETRVMTSRWTATLYKDHGTWKMLNVHIGSDLFDNPVLEALRSWLYKVGIGALLVGGLLGFLIARLTGRRLQRPTA
jgi:hypothetical protein